MEMERTIKTADLPGRIAAKLFATINKDSMVIFLNRDPFVEGTHGGPVLICSTNPKELVYPEGWYFAKGHFRNKGNSTTGIYSEVPFYRSGGYGELWE